MGFARGPKIETDGLVLYLDAANKKSLEGEPTTNLIYENGTLDIAVTNILSGTMTKEIQDHKVIVDCTSRGVFRIQMDHTKLIDGETYTYSFKYRNLTGSGNTYISTDWCDTISTKSKEEFDDYTYEWGTASKGTYNSTYRFIDFLFETGQKVEIWDIQVEHKPYVTPFTDGVRDTWKDLTKNGNDGGFIIPPTFNNTSKTLNFNGVNNYVAVSNGVSDFEHSWSPDGTSGNSEFTYEIWVKTFDNVGTIISKPWNGNGQYNIKIHTGSFILLAGNSANTLEYGTGISNGMWTQLVCWANSTDMGFYINGGDIFDSKTHNITGNLPSNGNNNVALTIMSLYPYGSSWGGNTSHAIEGELGLVRRYNKILTQNQVLNNYNATKSRYGL